MKSMSVWRTPHLALSIVEERYKLLTNPAEYFFAAQFYTLAAGRAAVGARPKVLF